MGILDRFRKSYEERTVTPFRSDPEDGWAADRYTGLSAASHSVTVACINAIAFGLAGVPARIKRTGTDDVSISQDHPVSTLVRRGPNMHQAWSDFVSVTVGQALLHGNALAEIVTDSQGRVTELRPIPWSSVQVSQAESGRLIYDFIEPRLNGAVGRTRRLLEDQVFHLRDLGTNGLVGVPRLQRAPGSSNNATQIETHISAYYQNSSQPQGLLTTEKKVSEDTAKRIRAEWNGLFRGTANTGKTAVLEQGLQFQQLEHKSAVDEDIVAALRFTVEDICRIFQVPPVMVSDLSNSSFTNAETLIRWFGQSTLSQWATAFEGAFNRSVFTDREIDAFALDFDLSGLLRGDPKTRWESHRTALELGVLSPDEVRNLEGIDGPAPTPQPSEGET